MLFIGTCIQVSQSRNIYCVYCKKSIPKGIPFYRIIFCNAKIFNFFNMKGKETCRRETRIHVACSTKELREKLEEMEHEGYYPIPDDEWLEEMECGRGQDD